MEVQSSNLISINLNILDWWNGHILFSFNWELHP